MAEVNKVRPLVSIIILNYQSKKFIKKCLTSVIKTNYPNFEVIFVDNFSRDGSLEFVKKSFNATNLKIIENSENYGFAEGNNIGIKHSSGEYIVFLNVDTEVDPNWIQELVKVMKSNPHIGAAQSKLLLMSDRNRFDSAGHFLDYCGIESFESTKITGEVDYGQYDEIREIFYAKGAAMMVRKKALEKVGPFDPTYFVNHEDIDLCWRILLGGYKIVFVPKSKVYHAGGGGAAGTARKERQAWILFHLRKNHVTSLIKNYQFNNLVRYLPLYLTYLFMHGIYKLKDDIHIFQAYFKAVLWNLAKLRDILSERKRIQQFIRKVPDKEIMKYMRRPKLPLYFLQLY